MHVLAHSLWTWSYVMVTFFSNTLKDEILLNTKKAFSLEWTRIPIYNIICSRTLWMEESFPTSVSDPSSFWVLLLWSCWKYHISLFITLTSLFPLFVGYFANQIKSCKIEFGIEIIAMIGEIVFIDNSILENVECQPARSTVHVELYSN